jgi:LuxR family maltose regulon positive regulatory protein
MDQELSASAFPAGHVVRRRLLESALRQPRAAVTVVHAPAGYGKSTFMAQWHAALVEADPRAAHWITLSARHREPGAFAAALLEAVGVVREGHDESPVTQQALQLLTGGELRCTLFLDGLEAAICDEVDTVLAALVAAPGSTVHVVIGTRVRPRFICERLRLQGRIREVGAAQLKLDAAESGQLLPGFGSHESLRDAIADAEGWPIAIEGLAAFAGADDLAESANAHECEWRRRLAQYLAEEVVAPLPAPLRELLFDISILDAVTPELCDYVRQQTRSAPLLHELQDQHAVLHATGAQLRIPRLLRSTLLTDLTSSDPQRAAQLHCRASAWHERRGELVQAVQHALAADSPDLVGKIIERAGGIRLAFRAGPNFARDVLGSIPKSLQLSHPRIAYLKAYVMLKDGEIEGARALAQIAGGSRAELTRDRNFIADKAMLDALFAMDAGSLDQTVEVLKSAGADVEPVSATEIEAVCALRDSYMHQETGQLQRASVELNRAMNLSRLLEWDYSQLYADLLLGAIAAPQGQLSTARTAHLHVLESAERNYAGRHGLHHAARVLLAEVEYLAGFDRKARELAPRDIRDIEQCNCWFDVRAACYSLDLRLARLGGAGPSEIANRLDRIRRHLAEQNLRELDQLVLAEGAAALLLLGEQAAASVLLKELAIDMTSTLALGHAARPWRSDDSVMRALTLHELLAGDPQRGAQLAARWAARARNEGREPSRTTALVLQALALDAQEKSGEAFAFTREALAIVAETGAVQALLDLPHAHLRSLLERGSREDERLAEPSRHLLERLRSPASSADESPYSGALSDREILVLRGLQRGESNKVIAKSLRISENTVKFHAKNVFRKLGISRRRDVRIGKPGERRPDSRQPLASLPPHR